jgi:hypothetical protein
MPALLFLAVTLVSLVAVAVLAAEPEIPAKPEGLTTPLSTCSESPPSPGSSSRSIRGSEITKTTF